MRFGVVLRLNGKNTLSLERKPPELSAKWLLGPGLAKVTIDGFHTSDREVKSFEVLPEARSRRETFSYGEEAGTMGFFVFPERNPRVAEQGPAPAVTFRGNLHAITRGTFPEKTPRSASALVAQLRHDGRGTTRGLVVDGKAIDAPVIRREVEFEDRFVAAATIVYYPKAP